MQHTTKYKFNIIETSDAFSPDALNANARAVETQLAALAAADAADKATLQAADAANKAALLTAIGSGGKTARIQWGSYVGTGEFGPQYRRSIEVDFKPLLVFLWYGTASLDYRILMRPSTRAISTLLYVEWEDHAVKWYQNSDSTCMNVKNLIYYYTVIGESG